MAYGLPVMGPSRAELQSATSHGADLPGNQDLLPSTIHDAERIGANPQKPN